MTDRHAASGPRTDWQPVSGDPRAELFTPPSREHDRLLRRAAWLVSPPDGRGPLLGRFLRMVLVAPMTQLTFLSFDLQLFLYGVFHTTRTARVGHFVFQAAVTFWLLVAACAIQSLRSDGPAPHWLAVNGSTGLALLLLGWYLAMAWQHRLWGWFAAMVPVVGALYAGANLLYATQAVPDAAARTWWTALPLALHPWLWMAGCAFAVALSHAPEPKLPPRTVEGDRWLTFTEYLRSRATDTPKLVRGLRVGLFPLWGTLDEWWASPRLVPYGVLLLMFRFGYRPALRDRYLAQVDRAWASGNPALDYVGIGGGARLAAQPAVASRVAAALLAALATGATAPRADAAPPPAERAVRVTSHPITGTSIPRWTVRAALDAPIDRVWRVIDACASYRKTMPRVSESREISRQGPRVVCRTVVDMPLPFLDLEDDSELTATWTGERRVLAFRLLRGDWHAKEGSWTLEPLPDHPGWTQVTYVLHAVPDTSVPEALVRRGQASAMLDLFQNLAIFAKAP